MQPYPLFIDIETLPADPSTWTPPAVEAPANYRDADKIAAYVAGKQAELHGRTGLDVHEGRLLCVGLAAGDDEPTVAYDADLDNTVGLLDAVLAAWRVALGRGHGRAVLVGHNIAGFDAPWLWRLAVKHQHQLAWTMPYRKWGDGLADTMQMWSATSPTDRVRLDTIARFLGVEGKLDGMSGAEVWPAYQRGEHEYIRAYCEQDVRTVRAVYRAMVGA